MQLSAGAQTLVRLRLCARVERVRLQNVPYPHAGKEQERLALEAGFARATHYPVGFGLMGMLVATKGR